MPHETALSLFVPTQKDIDRTTCHFSQSDAEMTLTPRGVSRVSCDAALLQNVTELVKIKVKVKLRSVVFEFLSANVSLRT